MFYEAKTFTQSDYFVPRVVERQQLQRLSAKEKVRYFPDRGSSEASDVALYLGIRLVAHGAVAIFCGRKTTASNIAARAVEIFSRGYSGPIPGQRADAGELRKLQHLINEHYGADSLATAAAGLGIFVHHGNTPQGLRLAVEHSMQRGWINFVVCTSTLAQGVNLPIRYLIVSGVYQGTEKIKVRDFQNLMGRAGRAGMHTEGLVIFADPKVFDKRGSRREGWRFAASVELLSADKTESTTSALLEVLAPFDSADGAELRISIAQLAELLLAPEAVWATWANEVVRRNSAFNFDSREIVGEIQRRRHLLHSVESHLMANRGSVEFGQYREAAENLATKTLAYFLASDEQKSALKTLFGMVADYVQSRAPAHDKQAIYAKTLLGIDKAKQLEQWVADQRDVLASVSTNGDWLSAVWPIVCAQCEDKFFHSVLPQDLSKELADQWIQGKTYGALCAYARSREGSKSWGDGRRRLTDEDVIDFCENTLSYDAALVLAAIGQVISAGALVQQEVLYAFRRFQKSMSYGLPDELSIGAFDYGFSDRIIAQRLSSILRQENSAVPFEDALTSRVEGVRELLSQYPGYFASVLDARA